MAEISDDRALEFAENALRDGARAGSRDAELALPVVGEVRQKLRDARGKMTLTAEEVEVAYGLAVQVRRASEARNSAVRPLSDRQDRLMRDMSLMLGSSADGERRG